MDFASLKFTNMWWAFAFPIFLMALDVITGYYNAYKNKEVASSKMREGLGKKLAELSGIIFGILCKFAFGADFVMYALILYVCYMEILSLIENWDKLGFTIPEKWKDKINNKNN